MGQKCKKIYFSCVIYLFMYFNEKKKKMKKMKRITIIISVVSMSLLQAATLVFGDAYDATGSDTLDLGGANTVKSNVEISTVYLADTGSPASDPSRFNALVIGSGLYSNSTNYRTELSFVISGAPNAPAGFQYAITSVTTYLELSTNRGGAQIDLYEGVGIVTTFNTLPSATTPVLPSDMTGVFIPFEVINTNLDLNIDTIYSVTFDAPNVSSNEHQTFGSGISPSTGGGNIGTGGTIYVDKAPVLVIDYELVPIPEPSVVVLSLLGFSLVTRRSR